MPRGSSSNLRFRSRMMKRKTFKLNWVDRVPVKIRRVIQLMINTSRLIKTPLIPFEGWFLFIKVNLIQKILKSWNLDSAYFYRGFSSNANRLRSRRKCTFVHASIGNPLLHDPSLSNFRKFFLIISQQAVKIGKLFLFLLFICLFLLNGWLNDQVVNHRIVLFV